jgi:hypothetical protein
MYMSICLPLFWFPSVLFPCPYYIEILLQEKAAEATNKQKEEKRKKPKPEIQEKRERPKPEEPHAAWTATMTTNLRKLLGTDHIGTTALHMLSNSLAPTTYSNYDIGMRQFAAFCHEEDIHSLHATTHSIVRYTA